MLECVQAFVQSSLSGTHVVLCPDVAYRCNVHQQPDSVPKLTFYVVLAPGPRWYSDAPLTISLVTPSLTRAQALFLCWSSEAAPGELFGV